MKRVSQTGQFSRDIKRMRKRGKDLTKLREVVGLLAEGLPLPSIYRDHPLIGPWRHARDCHIEADWILIYTIGKDFVRLERTGAHSDLFFSRNEKGLFLLGLPRSPAAKRMATRVRPRQSSVFAMKK